MDVHCKINRKKVLSEHFLNKFFAKHCILIAAKCISWMNSVWFKSNLFIFLCVIMSFSP